MTRFRAAACLLVAVLLAAPAVAQPDAPPAPRRLALPKLLTPPRIDGSLSDPCWLAATPTQQFLDPAGQPGSPHTIARAGFTSTTLLIAFICLDTKDIEILEIELYPLGPLPRPAPAQDAAPPEAPQDPAPTVGPSPDRRVHIAITPGAAPTVTGAQVEVQAAFQRLKGGYTAELSIPLDSIAQQGFSPVTGDLWLANLKRRSGDASLVWSAGVESLPTNGQDDAFHRAGEWAFESPNLIPNGGAEEWENVTPKGWIIGTPGAGRAPASRDADSAIEGQTAAAIPCATQIVIRPADRIPLRPGAAYNLSLALWVRPSPGATTQAELAALPGKARPFTPPPDPTRVEMPFTATDNYTRPALTVTTKAGLVVVDDVRLEMVRP